MKQLRRIGAARQLGGIALLLFVTLVSVYSCRKNTIPQPTGSIDALILYAFAAEGRELQDRIALIGVDTILGREVLQGVLEGRSVVVCGSGVGMTNAAMMTQSLIDQFRPSRVIFTGIAGALDADLAIGDLAVCSTWATHDFVYWGRDSVLPGRIQSYSSIDDTIRAVASFDVDGTLLAAARWIASDTLKLALVAGRMPRVFVGGVGVSGNAFIDSKNKREWLNERFKASITDMESAAVVQVCRANGVPCLVVRAASDLAGGSDTESADEQLEQFFKVAGSNSAMFVIRLLGEL